MDIEAQLRKIIADMVFQLAVLMAENETLRKQIAACAEADKPENNENAHRAAVPSDSGREMPHQRAPQGYNRVAPGAV